MRLYRATMLEAIPFEYQAKRVIFPRPIELAEFGEKPTYRVIGLSQEVRLPPDRHSS